jgi:N-acylglucosamine-6-phosphate 2-epimerase
MFSSQNEACYTEPMSTPVSLPSFIVSVQAESHEPLATLPVMEALCESVLLGGADGLRLADNALIGSMRQRYPNLPIIGLHKPDPLPTAPLDEVYITATLANALALIEAGANIVALDATPRPRPNDETLTSIISAIRQQYPGIAVMGDIDSRTSADYAMAAGCDILGTTLSGYTRETVAHATPSPDFELLRALRDQYPHVPLVLEGRIWNPEEVTDGFEHGATAVVIGSAITRPHHITARFKSHLPL